MKKFSAFLCTMMFIFCMTGVAHAVPTGDFDYMVTTDNSLRLEFNDLSGTINYEFWLEAEPTESGVAWDAYYESFWEDEFGGSILVNFGGTYFNQSDTSWRLETLSNSALTGNGWLRIEVQDHGNATNPVAYLRNFTPSPVSGPAPVPEPATIVLLGLGIVGLAGASRKKLKK